MTCPAETTLLSIDIDGVFHSLDAAHASNDSRLPAAEPLAHSSWRLACGEDRIRELVPAVLLELEAALRRAAQ
ncbi:hypothetical protein [Ideonella dechloratans]|uniref:hypothetical protein n=1 Tax=Ideonella dechloratans TaxID=36863 RepID=UPI0035ADB38D